MAAEDIWAALQNQPGGMFGNPLFVGSLMGLGAAFNPQVDPMQAMGMGIQAQSQALQNQWAGDYKQLQIQQMLEERAKRQAQEQALSQLAGNPRIQSMMPSSVAGVLPMLPPGLQREAMGQAVQQAMAPPEVPDVDLVTGKLDAEKWTSQSLNQFSQSVQAGTPDYSLLDRKEDMGDFTGQGLDSKDIVGYGKEMNATPESVAEAIRTGDITRLQPRDPLDVPATRGSIQSYLNDVDRDLGPYRKVAGSLKRMAQSLAEGTNVGDIAVIYDLISTLDPNSVVREGEVALFQQARAMAEQIKSIYQKQHSQGFLTSIERQGLASLMRNIQEISQESYELARSDLQSRTEILRLPKSLNSVMPQISYPDATVWDKFKTANLTSGGVRTQAPPPPTTYSPEVLRKMAKFGISADDKDARQKLIDRMQQAREGTLR